jgi:hypothetical protein
MACARGIGAVADLEAPDDMPVPVEDWRAGRRRAVGVGSSSPMGEGDARSAAGE